MNGRKRWLLWADKILKAEIFSILQPQTWLMYCFFQENRLYPTVTQAAGDKIWHRTQRGSFVTSTFGWDPHHWIPHLGLIHSELARSWTHCSEWELKTADGAGVEAGIRHTLCLQTPMKTKTWGTHRSGPRAFLVGEGLVFINRHVHC